MTLPKLTKFEKLGYLLGQYGSDKIDMDTFWRQMQNLGYTQDDIDRWCEEFHQREAKRETSNGKPTYREK